MVLNWFQKNQNHHCNTDKEKLHVGKVLVYFNQNTKQIYNSK